MEVIVICHGAKAGRMRLVRVRQVAVRCCEKEESCG